MVFGRQNKKKKFYLGEKELKIVDSYKYLGLVLDRNFIFKAHLEKNLEKSSKTGSCAMWIGTARGSFSKGNVERVGGIGETGGGVWAEIWEKRWEQEERLQMEMGIGGEFEDE